MDIKKKKKKPYEWVDNPLGPGKTSALPHSYHNYDILADPLKWRKLDSSIESKSSNNTFI